MIAYEFVKDAEVIKATMLEWINAHTALFILHGDLEKFREGNLVRVNMNTLEMVLYVERTAT